MPLKSLHPIKFEPIWAQYETWGWEQQSDWALQNHQSNMRRYTYIEEQQEIIKENRIAAANAKAQRGEIESVVLEMIAAGLFKCP